MARQTRRSRGFVGLARARAPSSRLQVSAKRRARTLRPCRSPPQPKSPGSASASRGTLALPGEPGYDLAAPSTSPCRWRPRRSSPPPTPKTSPTRSASPNDNGLRVLPQRTGHGAVPMDLEDVLLVHTAQLDELQIDPAGQRARIGAGVIWQQVLDAAAPHGLAPLVGSAPGVGVVGFLTGGGVGPLVRTYGARVGHGPRVRGRDGRRAPAARHAGRARRPVLGSARRQEHARDRHRGRDRAAGARDGPRRRDLLRRHRHEPASCTRGASGRRRCPSTRTRRSRCCSSRRCRACRSRSPAASRSPCASPAPPTRTSATRCSRRCAPPRPR